MVDGVVRDDAFGFVLIPLIRLPSGMKDHIGSIDLDEIENGETVREFIQIGLKQRQQVRVADVAGRNQ